MCLAWIVAHQEVQVEVIQVGDTVPLLHLGVVAVLILLEEVVLVGEALAGGVLVEAGSYSFQHQITVSYFRA
jgi:hypothetical protein